MTSFRNLSLKIKMTLIITLTSCAALLLACAVFVAYELHSFRSNLVLELTTLAEITGKNCAAVESAIRMLPPSPKDYPDPFLEERALASIRPVLQSRS